MNRYKLFGFELQPLSELSQLRRELPQFLQLAQHSRFVGLSFDKRSAFVEALHEVIQNRVLLLGCQLLKAVPDFDQAALNARQVFLEVFGDGELQKVKGNVQKPEEGLVSCYVALEGVFIDEDDCLFKHLCKRLVQLGLKEIQVNLEVLGQSGH